MAEVQSRYVTLVSNDGYEFIIRRSAACVSGVIRRMLDPTSAFSEALKNRVVLENINAIVLEKVCEYFYYNEKHKDEKEVPDMEIPAELCLELLMAADYLDSELVFLGISGDIADALEQLDGVGLDGLRIPILSLMKLHSVLSEQGSYSA
ncbi:MAG: Transcription elongation factor B (SIII), polypeptide 1 (15kDa, elongin C) [Pycnora praestabilis]|nr:MAG: Transcription elongation factor B (SIII), polypeptide 1 (15kDa, elongin C) [Pycnora praestabilis]